MLPEGWQHIRLGEGVSKIGSGVTPRGGEEAYKPEGFPLIRSQNVGWGRLLLDNVCFIDREQHNAMAGTKLKSGDVLLNITGASIGRVASYYGEDLGANVNQHVCIIRSDGSLDPRFIEAFLLSEFGQKQVDQFQAGGNRQGLNFEQVGSFRLPRPPLPEQRKIAEILSTWDAAIAAQERLIANARAQKKALMQTLLPTGAHPPKKRLPGFSGEWVRKYFRDAVHVDRNSLGQNTPADFRFRYISLSEVTTGTIASNLPELDFANAPSRARRKLSAGDILMATVRPNLQAFARVGSDHAECIASTGFAVLTAKPGFDPSYIYHYLFSEHLTGQIDALVVGSSYPAINSSDIKGLSLFCSDEHEQAAIGQVLNASNDLIADHESQFVALTQEKSALMQQLLTGKRRVKLEEAA